MQKIPLCEVKDAANCLKWRKKKKEKKRTYIKSYETTVEDTCNNKKLKTLISLDFQNFEGKKAIAWK